jgi:hypothetical protein
LVRPDGDFSEEIADAISVEWTSIDKAFTGSEIESNYKISVEAAARGKKRKRSLRISVILLPSTLLAK